MKPIYKPLGKDEREYLQSTYLPLYLNGDCFEFAIALTTALEWPLFGLVGKTIYHAFVQAPSGRYFDARGYVTKADIASGISGIEGDYRIAPLTYEALRRVRVLNELAISQAYWIAQALWPELPWKGGPLVKYRDFLTELDALCEKHRVFIFASLPTTPPVLTQRRGDEHFVFQPSPNGRNYFFDRTLTGESD